MPLGGQINPVDDVHWVSPSPLFAFGDVSRVSVRKSACREIEIERLFRSAFRNDSEFPRLSDLAQQRLRHIEWSKAPDPVAGGIGNGEPVLVCDTDDDAGWKRNADRHPERSR